MNHGLPNIEATAATGLTIDSDQRRIIVPAGDVELSDSFPILRLMPERLIHLGSWLFRFGGLYAEAPGEEFGLVRGYADPDHDDSAWARSPRINLVVGGHPTWESDSYEGYAWYRTLFMIPDGSEDRSAQLNLGSPVDTREIEWSVFLDGAEITPELIASATLDLAIPSDLLGPGAHVLAVRQRLAPNDISGWRTAEREGWRRVDPYCLQSLALDPGPRVIEFSVLDSSESTDTITLQDPSQDWQLNLTYAAYEDGIIKSSRLTYSGSASATISDLDLASLQTSDLITLHPEGQWAGIGSNLMMAGVDPAAVVARTADGITCRIWPGLTLGTGDTIELPPVVLSVDLEGDFRHCLSRLLSRFGRPREDVRIYDPYGWCQISHASEPKIELDDTLMLQIDQVMSGLADNGVTFDYLALDCGWNDPEDLSQFHPANFPNGPATVLAAVERSGSQLMLWVSPSQGPRAFRHEEGLVNPGFEDCSTSASKTGASLCPAAEPWTSTFRSALLSLIENYDVKGFKLDGTDLFCQSHDHGHLPGIWSIYATTRAMIQTLQLISQAGADHIMLYWGCRSPWWLQWASTVWDRGYLVEAAAPSGRAAWAQRGSVMSSQDIGQVLDWWNTPPHLQDSLGVWLSDTAWASHLGADRWDDALVMDLARGTRAVQLWGDLRPLLEPAPAKRLAEVQAMYAHRQPELNGLGRPVGIAAAGPAAYGYAWKSDDGIWLAITQPGDESETHLDWESLGIHADTPTGVEIDYLSAGAQASVSIGVGGITLHQSGGSVVCLYLTDQPGPQSAGQFVPAGSVTDENLIQNRSLTEDVHDLGAAYVGRVPSLSDWGQGPVGEPLYNADMPFRTPPLDRHPSQLSLSYTAAVNAGRDAEVAVLAIFTRNGSAWHNDYLHDVTDLELSIDGERVQAEQFPSFRHEQAGSWSWMRYITRLDAGEHRLQADITTVVPDNVQCAVEVWLR